MLVARPYRPTTRPLVSEVCPATQRTTNLDFSVVIQSPIEADGAAPIEQFMPQRDAGFLLNIAQSRKISLKSNGRNIKTRIPRVSMRSGPSPWGENSGHLGWKRCCDNVRLSKVRKLAVREKLEARRRLGRFALTASSLSLRFSFTWVEKGGPSVQNAGAHKLWNAIDRARSCGRT